MPDFASVQPDEPDRFVGGTDASLTRLVQADPTRPIRGQPSGTLPLATFPINTDLPNFTDLFECT